MEINAKDISDTPDAPSAKEFVLSYCTHDGQVSWALGEDTGTDEVTVILTDSCTTDDLHSAKISAVLTAIDHIQARSDYDTFRQISLHVYSSGVRQELFELGNMFSNIYIPPRSAMTHETEWSRPCISACRELLGFEDLLGKAEDGEESSPTGRRREYVTIGTDGSVCRGRGGGGSYGWIADDGSYGMGPVDTLDILVAEISAITAALHHIPLRKHVRILTDSKPAIRHIERSAHDLSQVGNNRGATKALRLLHARMELHAGVQIIWVRSHSGVILNEGADRLARMARQTKDGVPAEKRAEIAQNIAADVIEQMDKSL
jgi:ribonuclease HI